MIKKILVTVLFTCSIVGAFSQDYLVDKVIKMGVQIDSLTKAINIEKEYSTQKLKLANDSITKIITTTKIESSNLSGKIEMLEKDTAFLNKEIQRLGKENFAKLEVQLKQKSDSINNLREKNRNQDSINKAASILSVKKEQEKYTEGQKDVLDKICEEYKSKEFDELIKSSTKQSIERDLVIIINDTIAKQKLQNLQKYFNAKGMLDNKFDEQEQQNAESQLKSLNEKSDLVEKLKTTIKDYKLCNEALKKTLVKIQDIDKKFISVDDNSQNTKLRDILVQQAWFFRNYHFNFTDYPFLSDVVLETMKRKQKDANADINDLLLKL